MQCPVKKMFCWEIPNILSCSSMYYCNNILFANMPVISYQEFQKTHLSKAFKYVAICIALWFLGRLSLVSFYMEDFRRHKVKLKRESDESFSVLKSNSSIIQIVYMTCWSPCQIRIHLTECSLSSLACIEPAIRLLSL